MKEKLDKLVEHLKCSGGLAYNSLSNGLEISQRQDNKSLKIDFAQVEDILFRDETEHKPFLQVNFADGKKILVTDELIGFKPMPLPGLKFEKLPKVVTTTDLVSVFEAAEEALSAGMSDEVEALKQVFTAILRGGENVGFDLTRERDWFARLLNTKASA